MSKRSANLLIDDILEAIDSDKLTHGMRSKIIMNEFSLYLNHLILGGAGWLNCIVGKIRDIALNI